MGCGQKKLSVSVAVPPAPSQRPLAPSVASVTSVANDKGDNEMILGAVYRYPGIASIPPLSKGHKIELVFFVDL